MSHTPTETPWRFNVLTGYVHSASGRKLAEICERVGCDPSLDLGQDELSRIGGLIAAAPNLYDSCLSALGALETLKSEHSWVGEIIAGITRSLKKATEGVHPCPSWTTTRPTT
jgi:hypothetical protein